MGSTSGRGLRLFTLLWFGNLVSGLGSGLIGFALAVEVLQGTGSVTRYALIGLSSQLPGLLLSPFAGVLADRFDRRRLLIAAGLGSAACQLLLYWVVRSEPLDVWRIYPVVALTFCFNAFSLPAFMAATAQLVGKEHYGRASGMTQLGASVVSILAPSLGGLALLEISLAGIVVLNLISYLVPVLLLVFVRFPPPERSAEGRAGAGTVRGEVRQGWTFLRERPGLFHLLLLFAAFNFFMTLVQTLLPPLVLGFASPLVLGLVLSITSAGLFVGGVAATVWGGPRRGRVRTVLGILLASGPILLLGGLRPNAALVASAAFLFVLGFPILITATQAIWLSKVPQDLQGRVFAIRRLIAGVAAPFALLAAGPLADDVFEPMMQPGGLLAPSLGRLIGTGDGRGIAVLFLLLALGILLTATVALRSRSLLRLEEELPDVDPATRTSEPMPRPDGAARRLGELGRLPAVALGGLLVAVSAAAVYLQKPPAPVAATAPASEFSALRAFAHVEVIAQEPHPVGSAAHAAVRDYLVAELEALGVETEVQRAQSRSVGGRLIQHVGVENVLARLPGTGGTGAVVLVAHYDSVPTSPGAGDNASGVAALLETLRALRAGAPLARDVVVLFSDAEEVGLHGARVFVEQHPWARSVMAVVNFDARGHGGPVLTFQTGEKSGAWLERLIASVPHPVGSSLLDHVYRRLPNTTDFTVFQEAGWAGYNLAFIEGLSSYHGMLDRPEALDLGSLQHQGAYALGLARGLGQLTTAVASTADRTYFNVLGGWMVSYPRPLAWLLAGGVVLGYLGVVWVGLRRRVLGGLGLVQGFLSFAGLMVLVPVVLTLVWLLVRAVAGVPLLMGSTPGAGRFMIAFALLGLALALALLRLFRRLVSVLDLAVGAAGAWLVLVLLTSGTWLPVEASFLFVWPLAGALVALVYLLRAHGDRALRPWRTTGVLALAAVPALLLIAPVVALFYVGLQGFFQLGGGALALAVLGLGLLVPQLEVVTARRSGRLAASVGAVGGVLLVLAVQANRAETAGLRQSSLLYALDADAGSAAWFSFDAEPTAWTRSVGLGSGERASLEAFFPILPARWPSAPAPLAELAAPVLERVAPAPLGAELGRAEREVIVSLVPATGAQARVFWLEPAEAVVAARLDGEAVPLRSLSTPGAPALVQQRPLESRPATLELRLAGRAAVRLVVVEQLPGLPTLPGFALRPALELPAPFGSMVRSDVSLVRRSLELLP